MKYRIGIDVGGTFTDAVVIDDDTYELVGTLKKPTTHFAKEGVAAGIVEVIRGVIEKYAIAPENIVFIAHGTTQATNALLEGDVVPVGILGMGRGMMEELKARNDTQVGDIELAPGKFLKTFHRYFDTAKEHDAEKLIHELENEGCQVIVASAAFAVDDPAAELAVMAKTAAMGIPGVGSHEISKLYGLKIRTRTAAINASILPKMMETADMTESSVKRTGIKAPLMIMRCDGGVMDINEVRKRPIFTMLSGPAAGVAGALMYEKISNGIFLEVGGTSTDISVIKNGKVMVEYAEVGGHKTYLNSLDVRTVGIAGGSMVRIGPEGVVDVGPRSAHIAGLGYTVYADPAEINDPQIALFQPRPDDPADYATVTCGGKQFAITVSCAANILGYVQASHYAYGSKAAAVRAFKPFAERYGISVEEFAKQIMDKASQKNEAVLKQLFSDYQLQPEEITLVGGGGGAAAIVPYLAEYMKLNHRIAKNAEVISPIGVALAMVRDVVERTISNPTDADILKVRREAEQAAIQSGAAPGSIELHVEVDPQRSIVRVIATGTTELRAKNLLQKKLPETAIRAIAAQSLGVAEECLSIIGSTGDIYIVQGRSVAKKCWGLLKKEIKALRVIDSEGVIRLQKNQGEAFKLSVARFEEELSQVVDQCTSYFDGSKEVPDVYVFYGKKIIDLSGLVDAAQIIAVAGVEIQGIAEDSLVYALICRKNNR
ncbi:N-methylhydantoinase A/oxoprolinase/acetone carboxylase beta subunit [Hydrogenispora ethanolica]|jgi:N-methylhydantoinase A/oxoprolinase/acetone carboxylase beta subunit|uniref:N-methylhydantoinase A/oxoprolinase/acetone carboxylase beta subunit n=1 Tax=Hydrogenispora ethanolica TaxID=1082276 RepID=A0A4R1R317_HYDET|nr:hydantoinase/oxoprolinase family protein [Hydrogenispora ethanolica]TCL59790.1 N-methylhydantoinase A/oxoprolinase/acetone carboxylase beta subunit [Hydrogenispora ethanolica]